VVSDEPARFFICAAETDELATETLDDAIVVGAGAGVRYCGACDASFFVGKEAA